MKKAKLFMMLALLVMGVSNLFAQNVTIRQTNGNLLAAVKNGGNSDSFFDLGGFATWKHEQLSLTMTTADADQGQLTENGQLANPCNNIFKSSDNESLILGRGNLDDCYVAIALPKGYRFTGYNITFSRNVTYTQTVGGNTYYGIYGSASFGETDGSFQQYNKGSNTYQTGIAYSDAGDKAPEYTIKRTIDEEDANVLYFKITNNGNAGGQRLRGRAFITLKHVELYFTAEADYTPLAADQVSASGASAVDIPFSTSKVDYGTLAKRNKSGNIDNNNGRISYLSAEVDDITANLTLYEADSYRDNTAAERAAWDGVEGKVVNYVASGHSIYTVNDYFKLGGKKKTDEETGEEVDDEQLYFIETPVWVESGTGTTKHKNPIGYRIVGAQFDYASSAGEYIPATFYIQDETGNNAWYMGTDGQFGYSWNPVLWSIDQDGYISGNGYYMYVSGTTLSFQSISQGKPSADTGTFEVVNNQIRRKSQQDQYLCFYYTGSGGYASSATAYISTDYENRVVYNQQRAASGDLTTVGSYTLKIYDKTGEDVLETIEVKDGNLSGTTELFEGFNNDAIKIGVIGTGLIKGHLTLQALDPYIDRLDIVCTEDDGNGSRAVQQFTSTDFSVKGGKFTFYVPESFNGNCVFTFENLYSRYGDESYYDGSGTGNARYSLVMSPYWSGTTNVYNTNPDHTYVDKIWTETVGRVKYHFNNADQAGTSGGDFEEYVFNPHLYGDGIGTNPQNFIKFFFTPEEINTEKTAYLFTCDETRYNIAPTTGIQHTYYAYYEMDITLKKKNFYPKLTWTKVYDDGETFYGEGNNLSNIKSDSQWGLKLETTEASDDGDNGYLTTFDIMDAIDKGINKTGAPTSKHQILYIDASPLQSIVKSQKTKTLVTPAVENEDGTTTPATYQYTFYELEDLQYKNVEGTKESDYIGKNALVYLPLNSTSSANNFAVKTRSSEGVESFHSSNDIVITDRYPFFAPFDIDVDGANYAVYERTLTNPEYGQINHASIVLPFTISIKDGVHTNPDNKGGQEFKLSQMNGTKALSKNGYDYTTDGYFTNLTSDSEANKPYVVSFTTKTDEDKFKIYSKGAYIIATPTHTSIKENGVFEGETGTGTYEGTYNFTHKGTFTGKKIANAKTKNVFYFSNNKFVNSATLGNGVDVYQLPFRTVYNYTFTPSSDGNNAKLNAFRIVFGENPDMSDTNGINEVQRDADLAVIPGDGCITLMARADKDVTIHAVNGMTVDKCSLRAGETRTVSVPAGVYVINGVKMVVK